MRLENRLCKSVCRLIGVSAVAFALSAGSASAQIRITEWMYTGVSAASEYVELKNFGAAAVDFTGWSFDDNSRTPGSFSLSGFGLVAPGQTVIFTEATAAAFRTIWSLAPTVAVLGSNTNNLGRNDEINIYDALLNLVDRLTYNDQGTGNVAGPRTQNVSGVPGSFGALGANNASLWMLSAIGDQQGSYRSTEGDIGSPGFSALAAPGTTVIPVPAAGVLMLVGLGLLGFAARRRSAR